MMGSQMVWAQSSDWSTAEQYNEAVDGEEYQEETPEEQVNKEFSPGKAPAISSEIFSFLAIAFLVAFGIFLLYKIIENSRLAKVPASKSRIRALSLSDAEENLSSRDLTDLIKQAYEANDYRAIVRLEYLQLLQNLDDNKHIVWKRQKTDYMYFYELSKPEMRKPFGQLIEVFQYIWYGHMEATENHVKQTVAYISQINPTSHEK
ncbi:MAG: hypothetical protein SchgKO_22530 [Schleiferiaceae bacterium]